MPKQVVSLDEPVPPSQLQSRTPRDLETICLKCLSKEPAKRYASALDLAEDLARFTAGRPVLARPVGRLERGWRWCLRNKAVAGLLATVAATLLLGAGVATGWYFANHSADSGTERGSTGSGRRSKDSSNKSR